MSGKVEVRMESYIKEQLSRTEMLIGEEGIGKLQNCHVVKLFYDTLLLFD